MRCGYACILGSLKLLRMVRKDYADPIGLQIELSHSPEVWDTLTFRTTEGPHRELSDIWVRYNALENFDGDMQRFNAEHVPSWYPVVEKIPSARYLSEKIAYDFDADLGGVLITKIPPHKQCYPHVDKGWHAGYYEKFAFQVKGNKSQSFHVEDEILVTVDGDLF